jgi:WD40 repeat protein
MQVCPSVSPCGDYIIYGKKHGIQRDRVRRHDQRHPPTASVGFIAEKDMTATKWSPDSSLAMIISKNAVEIVDPHELVQVATVKNGSGGLGSIASADFLDNHHILLTWEFGKTRLWHLSSGKSVDLPDIKTTCNAPNWQCRPGPRSPPLFALLARPAAEDHLVLQFTSLRHAPSLFRLPTVDAQAISWSPDGRWLALLDVPTATPNLYIYTPDGHLFRSFPSPKDSASGLSIKDIAWSPEGRLLALSYYDGRVELLNSRTFSSLAAIEHNTTIDQTDLPVNSRAPVWQENVSATNERSYTYEAQPVSPPLSRIKVGPDPAEHGVAESCFSCDGRYLATRDGRMLNTVWIWNMTTLLPHAVLIQHTNVRRVTWHPTQSDTLMIDCAEAIAHLFDAASGEAPQAHHTQATPNARLSWVPTASHEPVIILVTQRTKFDLFFPGGKPDFGGGTPLVRKLAVNAGFDEGVSEDSLFDVLSGRKPLPPKTQPSYTEMVDLDVQAEDDMVGELDDTFREKRKHLAAELDPLDDSDIF